MFLSQGYQSLSYLSGGAAWGGGALGGFRLRKAFSHLFFMLPADDDDSFRSTAVDPLSAFAANNSLCLQRKCIGRESSLNKNREYSEIGITLK